MQRMYLYFWFKELVAGVSIDRQYLSCSICCQSNLHSFSRQWYVTLHWSAVFVMKYSYLYLYFNEICGCGQHWSTVSFVQSLLPKHFAFLCNTVVCHVILICCTCDEVFVFVFVFVLQWHLWLWSALIYNALSLVQYLLP